VRDEIRLATKMPPFLVSRREDFDRIFDAQLDRLGTSFIDYYLIHMLPDVATWNRIGALGAEKWIEGKKKSGQIRNIGFSYHGGRDDFQKVLGAYGWEFAMIQYNYLDERSQAGRDGLEKAASKGVPVMVMEPLRGGKLANALPQDAKKTLDESGTKRTPAEWAFNWLWNQPEVTCVLSGMNTVESIDENARCASDSIPGSLSSQDLALLARAREAIEKATRVPCTACGYCMPCPKGVDIPNCFSCLNTKPLEGTINAFMKYLMQTGMRTSPSNASLCVRCGRCEKHCPQSIHIMDSLETVKKELEGFLYKPARFAVKKFMKF
jgi:predicted aldo/keto reductase-like oxidoreductase